MQKKGGVAQKAYFKISGMGDKIKTTVGDKEERTLPTSNRLKIQTDRLPTEIPVWIPAEVGAAKTGVESQSKLNLLFKKVLSEWEESGDEEVTFQAVNFSRGRQIDSLPKPQAAQAFRNGLKEGEICVAIYKGYSGPAYAILYFHPEKKQAEKTPGEVILILFPADFTPKVPELDQKPMVQQAITNALRLDLETTAKGIKRQKLAPPTDPNQIVQIFSF